MKKTSCGCGCMGKDVKEKPSIKQDSPKKEQN
jgi:hypothetical protein